MNFKSVFLILIIFCLSVSIVSANENITDVEEITDNSAENNFELTLDNENELDYADNSVNDDYLSHSSNYEITTKNLIKYYKNDSQFEFKISDLDKNPVSGVNVSFKVNGKDYVKTTNKNGSGKLNINFAPGSYVITTTFNGKSVNNTIKILSRFSSKDVTSTYGKQTQFSISLVDKMGNPMVKELVTFKIGSKTYKKYTDSKGVAILNIKYNAGNYVIKYSADGISGKNNLKIKNAYKLTVYKWGSGADVTKNTLIKNNIPDSALVKKVVKGAKSGTPVIKFKGGTGKIVFITAGVHGNELSSQVAAMQLINYLEDHPIKGTVYIMPFMNPKATSKNVRNYGVNLNSKANVKGTISYKTVKLIVKFKCSSYGDFHCTMPGGKPGKNVAMGSYLPTAKSATLAKFISKKSNVNYLIYKKAAVEYPGALEDIVNLKHIPSVTCEVITPHGTIASGTVPKSLSMMKSLLKFNSVI